MIGSIVLGLALVLGPALPADPHVPNPQPSISREEAAASSSRGSDQRGELPSMYQGIYYYEDQEPFRKCVGNREGSFAYMVVGGGGNNYHGTYQFHDGDWRRGLTYMMAAESRATHDGLRWVARDLIDKPIHKWSRYWQDRAFYTALNIRGKWTGKFHWDNGSHYC